MVGAMTTPDAITAARQLLNLPLDGVIKPYALKTAYRAAARAAHPDVAGDNDQMVSVNAAFALLQEHPEPPSSIDDPNMLRLDIPGMAGPRREPPRWSRASAEAAGAIRFDDLIDDLRTVVNDRPVRPQVQCLANGDVLVSRVPPGGSVAIVAPPGRVQVLDAQGEEVEAVWVMVDVDAGEQVMAEAEISVFLAEQRRRRA